MGALVVPELASSRFPVRSDCGTASPPRVIASCRMIGDDPARFEFSIWPYSAFEQVTRTARVVQILVLRGEKRKLGARPKMIDDEGVASFTVALGHVAIGALMAEIDPEIGSISAITGKWAGIRLTLKSSHESARVLVL